MPLVEVKTEDDARLEQIAPEYLRGPKATTRRVQWAIHEIVRIRSNGQPAADAPTEPSSTS